MAPLRQQQQHDCEMPSLMSSIQPRGRAMRRESLYETSDYHKHCNNLDYHALKCNLDFHRTDKCENMEFYRSPVFTKYCKCCWTSDSLMRGSHFDHAHHKVLSWFISLFDYFILCCSIFQVSGEDVLIWLIGANHSKNIFKLCLETSENFYWSQKSFRTSVNLRNV